MNRLQLFILVGTLAGLLILSRYINEDLISISSFSVETAVIVISMTLLSICFKFCRFSILLNNEIPRKPVSQQALFFATLQFVVIYPFRIGECLRLAVLSHYLGLSRSLVLVGFERFFDLVCVSSIIVIFILFGILSYRTVLYIPLIAFIGALILTLLLSLIILFIPCVVLIWADKRPHVSIRDNPVIVNALVVYEAFLEKSMVVKQNGIKLILYSFAAILTDLVAVGLSLSLALEVVVSGYLEILLGNRFDPAYNGAVLYNILIVSSVVSMTALSLLSPWFKDTTYGLKS